MAEKKRVYMAEAEIQQHEHKDAAQLGSVFFVEGVQTAANHFVRLLRSYRIAANVAHSAWKLVAEIEQGTMNDETFEELKARLRLFAPEAPSFKQPKPVLEYGCRLLEEVYDHLSRWNDPVYNTGIMLEQLFKKIEEMRHDLAT
jgi:hypothetical protein